MKICLRSKQFIHQSLDTKIVPKTRSPWKDFVSPNKDLSAIMINLVHLHKKSIIPNAMLQDKNLITRAQAKRILHAAKLKTFAEVKVKIHVYLKKFEISFET